MIEDQSCRICYYYRIDATNVQQGTCREKSPTAIVSQLPNGGIQTMMVVPPVKPDFWCGRFRHQHKKSAIHEATFDAAKD